MRYIMLKLFKFISRARSRGSCATAHEIMTSGLHILCKSRSLEYYHTKTFGTT